MRAIESHREIGRWFASSATARVCTPRRAGILKEFKGISDPCEAPVDAEVTMDTDEPSPEEAAQEIIPHLEREGFIGVNGASA